MAHDDDSKPKTPTKAQADLKAARKAMDAYKARLLREGKYACCMKKPVGSQVDGCDLCAKENGSCNCGANLAQGKGVCGDCFAGWKRGQGNPDFGKVDVEKLNILPAPQQGMSGKAPEMRGPEFDAYSAAILKAKRAMVGEQRYACCVGKGGCDECAYEGYCPCAADLAADLAKKPGEKKEGVCGQCVDGQHAGHGRLGKVDMAQVHLAEMGMEHMAGLLGPWSMSREGSGTSWLPESSPMYGRMDTLGRYRVMHMGSAFAAYADSGGPRGEGQFYAPTQYMFMARRETGGGILGFRAMLSLDPLLIGGNGYPLLFQTGETWGGQPLQDRQHPHDLFMELGISYSRPLGKDAQGFLYFAPVGEPALGPTAFPHRPSAWDNPNAPISHHWLDSSHITFGTLTAGLALGRQWKAEASVFTGREPDEHRYNFDPMRFDSVSGRLTYNPNRDWSFQASYGFLKEPEVLEPGENQHRLTLSAAHNRAFANGDNWATLLAWGRNIKDGGASNALLFETAYTRGPVNAFFRYDNTEKNELVGAPPGNYRIHKFTLGGIYNFQKNRSVEQGIGASVDFHAFPSSLKPFYGDSPVSFGVFYRLRFGKM